MKPSNKKIQELILDEPSYWLEGINGLLYNCILDYMEKNNLNNKQLAKHLGISRSRVSQILNDGNINYSLEKIIGFAIKVGFFPDFKFIEKEKYFSIKETEKTK